MIETRDIGTVKVNKGLLFGDPGYFVHHIGGSQSDKRYKTYSTFDKEVSGKSSSELKFEKNLPGLGVFVKVPKGQYKIQLVHHVYETKTQGSWARLPENRQWADMVAMVVRLPRKTRGNRSWVHCGDFNVDSGTSIVTDPSYFIGKEAIARNTDDVLRDWGHFVHSYLYDRSIVTLPNKYGAVSITRGYGKFSVFIQKMKNKITDVFVLFPPGYATRVEDLPTGCSPESTSEYINRVGPAFPASRCHGAVIVGNDGTNYVSSPDKNGVFSWRSLV
jgi:hypothetical protein